MSIERLSKRNKNQNSLFRPGDLILILILFLCALLTFAFIKLHTKTGKTVCVKVDGQVYGEYPLDQDREITIWGENQSNILRIKDGKADMTKADCPDKICVRHRPISRKGETIVCLPHKLVVEIVGNTDQAKGGASDESSDGSLDVMSGGSVDGASDESLDGVSDGSVDGSDGGSVEDSAYDAITQ